MKVKSQKRGGGRETRPKNPDIWQNSKNFSSTKYIKKYMKSGKQIKKIQKDITENKK